VYRPSDAQDGQQIAPIEGVPPQDASDQMQGGRPRRAGQPRRAPAAVDHVHRQIVLEGNAAGRADALEELERLAVAPDEHVLPVVHALAGGRIDERRGAASE
jgi:hypothetical protein